jgi:hypothetical protein
MVFFTDVAQETKEKEQRRQRGFKSEQKRIQKEIKTTLFGYTIESAGGSRVTIFNNKQSLQ